jgi:hypothetical protein
MGRQVLQNVHMTIEVSVCKIWQKDEGLEDVFDFVFVSFILTSQANTVSRSNQQHDDDFLW